MEKKLKQPFGPTWMYHPQHGAVLFENEQQFEKAMKEKSWVDHPAKAGKDEPSKPNPKATPNTPAGDGGAEETGGQV